MDAGQKRVDLDAIEATAKAATPGAGWDWSGGGRPRVIIESKGLWPSLQCEMEVPTVADAQHIAGMNPQTTLALVAELRELRRFEQRIRNVAARSPASRVGTVVDNYDADPSTHQAEDG